MGRIARTLHHPRARSEPPTPIAIAPRPDPDDRIVDVLVPIEWGGLAQLDRRCTIVVDGESVPVERVA